jgi:Na+/H+-dicarboxylate symporter
MVAYAIGVMVLSGQQITFAAFVQFILQASVVAVAGIPGGMVLASASIAESVLGISVDSYAMIVTLYMILDGVGTACNVAGSGAIAMIVDRFRGKDSPAEESMASKVMAGRFQFAHAA